MGNFTVGPINISTNRNKRLGKADCSSERQNYGKQNAAVSLMKSYCRRTSRRIDITRSKIILSAKFQRRRSRELQKSKKVTRVTKSDQE